jgi:hypothetical protein
VVENSFFFRWGVLIGDREAYLAAGARWQARGNPYNLNFFYGLGLSGGDLTAMVLASLLGGPLGASVGILVRPSA